MQTVLSDLYIFKVSFSLELKINKVLQIDISVAFFLSEGFQANRKQGGFECAKYGNRIEYSVYTKPKIHMQIKCHASKQTSEVQSLPENTYLPLPNYSLQDLE